MRAAPTERPTGRQVLTGRGIRPKALLPRCENLGDETNGLGTVVIGDDDAVTGGGWAFGVIEDFLEVGDNVHHDGDCGHARRQSSDLLTRLCMSAAENLRIAQGVFSKMSICAT